MTTGYSDPQTNRRIIIGATIAASLRHLVRHPLAFLRAAAIPAVLSFALALAQTGYVSGTLWAVTPWSHALLSLGYVGLLGIFGYGWQRFYLRGAGAGKPRILPEWDSGLSGYVVGVLTIAAIWNFPTIATDLLGNTRPVAQAGDPGPSLRDSFGLAVSAVAYVAIPYLVIRCSFAFPAAAMGQSFSIRAAWADTRGRTLQLFGLIATILVPAQILKTFLGSLGAAALLVQAARLSNRARDMPDNSGLSVTLAFGSLSVTVILIAILVQYAVVAILASAIANAFASVTGMGAIEEPPIEAGPS